MGFIPKVGNDNRAVSYSQYINALKKGAHGKRNVAVSKQTGGRILKTKISTRSFSSKATLRPQRKVATRTPSQLKTIVKLAESQQVFHSLIRRGTISTEAKAVYSAALVILSEVSRCKNFSAANIQKAIKIGLTQAATTTGLKGTVGFFRKSIDEGNNYGSKTGQPSLCVKKDGKKKTDHPKCINACKNLELSMWGIDTPKNIQNVQITDITLDSNETNDLIEVYNVQSNNNKGKPFKIRCPKGFPIKEYMDQLCAESNSYSGDITIKKAEPGSVFVRVFGKEQSPLRSCWCNAADDKSAVTEAKDLYDKLAVKFEWNGDGNMAVLVVPNDIEIYFAEGTIASQTGDYSEKTLKGKEEVEQKHTYIYQGGGTQTNILAKNVSEGYRPFADLKGEREKIWQQIMFVFRDDGIIDMEKLSQDPTQNPQQNEQK